MFNFRSNGEDGNEYEMLLYVVLVIQEYDKLRELNGRGEIRELLGYGQMTINLQFLVVKIQLGCYVELV